MLKDFFEQQIVYDALGRTRDNIFDFSRFLEYGKVNDYSYYVPKREDITKFPSFGEQSVLKFVVSDFEKLLSDLNYSCFIGNIPNESLFHINNIDIKKSYMNPYVQYYNYLFGHFKVYLYLGKDDVTCAGMIKNFLEFMKLNNYKFTIYHALETGICDVFTSGLAIAYTDNNVEKKDIYEDLSFSYFLNLCKKYNFYVHKNKPTILVYRLNPSYDFSSHVQADDEKLFSLYKIFFEKCWELYREVYKNKIDVRNNYFQIDNNHFFNFLTERRLFEKKLPVEGMLSAITDLQQRLGYAEAMKVLNSSSLKDDTNSPIPEIQLM